MNPAGREGIIFKERQGSAKYVLSDLMIENLS